MKKIVSLIYFLASVHFLQAQVWTTLSPQPNSLVGEMFYDSIGNNLYCGGQFTIAGSDTVNHIFKWDGSSYDSLGSGFNERVEGMAIYNGEFYAGGWFTASGSNPIAYIAKWNGFAWQQVGNGFDNAVLSLAVFNGELYAGGAFTLTGSTTVNHIAKWDGTAWIGVGTGTNNWIYSMFVFKSELYVGGTFTMADGNPVSRIGKWNGTQWSALGSGLNNSVNSMTEYNGVLCVGGAFINAGGLSANYIAAWDGTNWSALGAGFNNGVNALSVYNTELYACGSFTASSTTSLTKIARWNGFGWNTVGNFPSPASVRALGVYGGDLYVGGVVMLNSSTTCFAKWNIPPPSPPTANFYVNDTVLEVGGYAGYVNQTLGSSVTYNWSFPGGSPPASIATNPIVQYNIPGTYDVTLIASNSAGTDSMLKTTLIVVDSFAHPIIDSVSKEYIQFEYDSVFHVVVSTGITTALDTSVKRLIEVYYYKPPNYDPATSPILWGVHGQGGNGYSEIPDLMAIANHRNALVVSASMLGAWAYSYIGDFSGGGALPYFYEFFSWYPTVFKEIYKHILHRENRISAPVHLIGFSAGGQFVTRYMLMRQGKPDSIPIHMAVSTNPHSYTFCANTASRDTFSTVPMFFPYGLLGGIYGPITTAPFSCNDHIIQYYNENYGVLIGTADTISDAPGNTALDLQGRNRYERAVNFYAFSDSDATARGTNLQWPYVEISGVGHYQPYMYNVKLNATDSSTIAETLLFDTPYHNVPSLAPVAGFYADTTIINVNGTISFTNTSINALTYSWNFGDGSTSTQINPSHTYTVADTFTVSLTATGGTGCENNTGKRHYIIVIPPLAIAELNSSTHVVVYPNPVTDQLNVTINSNSSYEFILYDVMFRKLLQQQFTNAAILNIQGFAKGIYIYEVSNKKGVIQNGKVVKQ